MAQYTSHLNFSLGIAVTYGLFGLILVRVNLDLALLAMIITLVAGLLPDIDATSAPSTRDMVSLISLFPPLMLMYSFPGIRHSEVARVVLIGVGSYGITRLCIFYFLEKYTTRRGMMHSMPMAVIFAQVVYLLFFDLSWNEKSFLAAGALIGYISHLAMDGFSKVDIAGKPFPPEIGGIPVAKLGSKDTNVTWLTWGTLVFLSYFVFSDISPHLRSITKILLAQR